MSTITTINGNDRVRDSRAVINTNFANLNTDKVETLADLDITKTATQINNAVDNSPTSAEKSGLAAGGSFGTPGPTNKYVTETFLATQVGTAIVRKYENSGSPHTWTKPAGLKYVVVEVQAAGGKGGEASATVDTGRDGGGSGGYARKLFLAADLGSTVTITVGLSGSNTTFGTHITCTSGATGDAGSGGGTATGGDINIAGGVGMLGINSLSRGGRGASSPLGEGGNGGSGDGSGSNGTGYGSGGGGASQAGSSGMGTGGLAAPAVVMVTEQY